MSRNVLLSHGSGVQKVQIQGQWSARLVPSGDPEGESAPGLSLCLILGCLLPVFTFLLSVYVPVPNSSSSWIRAHTWDFISIYESLQNMLPQKMWPKYYFELIIFQAQEKL